MVRFDSWRAVSPGNRADRNLVTKSTYGGRAIWRAVMRVKSEQAPKAVMWTPTRRETGEGSTDREVPGAGARPHDNHRAPIRSAGVVGIARQKGSPASVGEARDDRGVASRERRRQGGGSSGCRKGSEVPRKPGNAGGGKGPYFCCVCEGGKDR